jgi:hypothetical protein
MQLLQQHENIFNQVNNYLESISESAIALKGLDSACIGVYHDVTNDCFRLVYNVEMIIESLMSDGMHHDEAVEYFSFNVEGSCLGNNKPILVQ